ncbi:hypothetical protein AB0M02_34725 [Actinoplanes sp. NPDC051861]|uniref:hypothetical protein n=1 Tax=Actinoplanes sp. NPDC051861 TaxID=3155170 RepID=UPI003443DBAC
MTGNPSSRLRAMIDHVVGADAVSALRRQISEQESRAAVQPDLHRVAPTLRNLKDRATGRPR